MQKILRLVFPALALALVVAAALILAYPSGREVETRPVTTLIAYTERITGASTLVREESSTETYPQTIVRTEVKVITEGFTILRARRSIAESYYRLPALKAGDRIIVEAGPQVKIWIEGPSGEVEMESDTGELSYQVGEDGKYRVWFKAEGLEEAREVFIGVSRPETTYTETWETYMIHKWTTTVTKGYTSIKVSASTIYTYRTFTKPASAPHKIWLSAALLAVAVSIAFATVLLWRAEPRIKEEAYREENQNEPNPRMDE